MRETMTEYRQQKSRESDDLEETFEYGPIPRRPQPRPRAAYRPRSYASDSIPFADAEVTFSNGGSRGDSLDRRRLPKYHIPPPPPPPPPRTSLETEDSTSLNNILDALQDLGDSQDSDSDRRSSMATTGSMEESEDEMDVLTELPDKWSVAKSVVSMRCDNGARVSPETDESGRLQPRRPDDAREDLIIAAPLPTLKLQVGFYVIT